jgi:hypothetical protein
MYDPRLKQIIQTAIFSLHTKMTNLAPFMAEATNRWTKYLSKTPNPEDYYLHPKAFPMLLLPWWMEQTFRPSPESQFQSAVAYSSINGYYYTRLVDNLMDEGGLEERRLLPAAHFFLCQSQLAYYPYFDAHHDFWRIFLKTLVQAGETAMRDANTADIDLQTFQHISAQKVCGAKIPVAAVASHHQRPALIEPWSRFVDLFGCWHQMTDDLFDWHKDLRLGSPTYFLSEARRQAGEKNIPAWVLNEGFNWGCNQLSHWFVELRKMAQQLQSTPLLAYLDIREELFQKQEADARKGLKSLSQLLNIIGK